MAPLTSGGKRALVLLILFVFLFCSVGGFGIYTLLKPEEVVATQPPAARQPQSSPTNPSAPNTGANEPQIEVTTVVGGETVSITPTPFEPQEPTQETGQGLVNYKVGFDTYPPYFIGTIVAKMLKLDLANGINLELVPFCTTDTGEDCFTEEQRSAFIKDNTWQGLMTTLDKPAKSPDIASTTAIIQESNGLDALVCRPGINTFNDLRGKLIGFLNESVGQFFAYYVVDTVDIPVTEVQWRGYDALTSDGDLVGAVNDFVEGKLDCVSGWEPDINAALPPEGPGHYVVTSHVLRVPIDVILTSNQAIKQNPAAVLGYHKAYCQALKFAIEDPAAAEQLIIEYGKATGLTGWTYVGLTGDWVSAMSKSALAPCDANAELMAKVGQADDPLTQRLANYQQVWQEAGASTGNLDEVGLRSIIAPQFMLEAAKDPSTQTAASPIDSSFSLAGEVNLPPLTAESMGQEVVLATLPLEQIEFKPNSIFLTKNGMELLDEKVIPFMKAAPYVYLNLFGSAALPVGSQYVEADSVNTAFGRVQQIWQYLVDHGIDGDRITYDWMKPPVERCNTEQECASKRFVRFEAFSLGY